MAAKFKNFEPFKEAEELLFWSYKHYEPQDIEKVSNALANLPREISTKLTSDVYESVPTIVKLLGLHVHPLFQKAPMYKKPSKMDDPNKGLVIVNNIDPPVKVEDAYEEPKNLTFAIFNHVKIDILTLKVYLFCLGYAPQVQTLKFSHNDFSPEEVDAIIDFLTAGCKIKKLFFDFNPIPQKSLDKMMSISASPTIEFLTLRSCKITTGAFVKFCSNLSNNWMLKLFDFYDNQISDEALVALRPVIKSNRILETISFGKNNFFSASALKDFFQEIGKFPMTEEEVLDYRKTEKEIAIIIQKNLKLRAMKKPEEPVQILDPIEQDPTGRKQPPNSFFKRPFLMGAEWSMMKNSRLRVLNFMENKYDDQVVPLLNSFLVRTPENFKLVFVYNPIDKEARKQLGATFKNKLMI